MGSGGDDPAPAPPRRDPSLADVAREAGVSAQTASRVATGKDIVKPATRERVITAMRQLGYRPNGAARALKSGRFRNVGVIMFSLDSYGNMRTLEAIAAEATRSGYSLTLLPLDAATQTDVTGAFAQLDAHAVDGILIVIETHVLDEAEVELPTGLPIVVVDSGARHPHPVVDTDQGRGARQATEHLLALGHETVWHVAGPDGAFSARRRREAWRRALLDRGAHVPGVWVGDWSGASGHAAGEQLARIPDVTAVFAANDQMALGVMHALHRAGRRVPDDVSVVGFDDMPESAEFWPPLTTVRQDFERVGAASFHALVALIEGEQVVRRRLISTRLVVRESTAPPHRSSA